MFDTIIMTVALLTMVALMVARPGRAGRAAADTAGMGWDPPETLTGQRPLLQDLAQESLKIN